MLLTCYLTFDSFSAPVLGDILERSVNERAARRTYRARNESCESNPACWIYDSEVRSHVTFFFSPMLASWRIRLGENIVDIIYHNRLRSQIILNLTSH